jgi:hypothetical protein
MRYLLIVLFAFIAYPAGAERYEGDLYPLDPSALYGIYVTIVEPDDAGFIGRIVHHNRETLPAPNQGYRETFLEFETERGLFILRLRITTNNTCAGPNRHGCPDTLTIWEMPEGVMADALEVETPERGMSIINLFEWSGT